MIPDRICGLLRISQPHVNEKNDRIPVVCFQHVMSPTGTGKDDSGCWSLVVSLFLLLALALSLFLLSSLSSSESRLMFSLVTGERTSDSPSCFGVSTLVLLLLLVARGSATMLEEELPTEIPS